MRPSPEGIPGIAAYWQQRLEQLNGSQAPEAVEERQRVLATIASAREQMGISLQNETGTGSQNRADQEENALSERFDA